MVVFDSSLFILAVDPSAPVPLAPGGAAISHAHERVLGLLRELDRSGTRVLIPTPVLAESFVRTPAAQAAQHLTSLRRLTAIELAEFDARAAFEVAAMGRIAKRGKSVAPSAESWAKVKYDRQIVAIAKVRNAHTLYCADADLGAFAETHGITVRHLAELQLPDDLAQRDLGL